MLNYALFYSLYIMIELIGLNKTYAGVQALHDINLFIQEGEIFGIIGKSGAGKSTLLRSINLLERPDSGQVIIDHQSLLSLNTQQLRLSRHKMGMIFQQFNLLNGQTVYENIALPLRIQKLDAQLIHNKIKELLPLVELDHKEQAYPHQLSGGQKQRVAIARALSYSPKILLCDEATSALDPQTTESILQLLQKINRLYGITVVLITHEMDVVKRICHRIALMEHGKIVECNALSSILNDQASQARELLFSRLSPTLPACLATQLTNVPNDRPLLRLLFQGSAATVPFISKTSRELEIDINILLANIDRFDNTTCGVLIIELQASYLLLDDFIQRCQQANLTVEILGYVSGTSL